jgi:hypothetical protein
MKLVKVLDGSLCHLYLGRIKSWACCASHLNDIKGLFTSNRYYSLSKPLHIKSYILLHHISSLCMHSRPTNWFLPSRASSKIPCYANPVSRYANVVQTLALCNCCPVLLAMQIPVLIFPLLISYPVTSCDKHI